MRPTFLPGIVFGSVVACTAVAVFIGVEKGRQVSRSGRPDRRQLQCGQWCVYRCSWLLGVPLDMRDVIQMLPPTPTGHSMADLCDAFRRIGLTAIGYKESFESFGQGKFPCVVQLSPPDHFVVAAGRLKGSLLVFDGSGVRRRVTEESLKRRWTGNVLRVR